MTAGESAGQWAEVLVRLLAGHGFRVHILDAGTSQVPGRARDRGFRDAAVTMTRLDDCPLPPALQVRNLHPAPLTDRSERVRHALEWLQRTQPFDLVIFPVLGGPGFRAVQAKRAGLAFHDTALVMYFHTGSQWLREHEQRWPSQVEDLEVAFTERYSFEQADVLAVASPSLLDHAARIGWRSQAQTWLLPVPGDTLNSQWLELLRLATYRRSPTRASDDELPLVTVGIAHYNLGRYLPEALASLAAQTYPRLEVLVIDDGSTDPRSRAVFEEMASRHPQFRFLTQSNVGIGATRNRALDEARGTYFLPMDADNVARPDMVERFVNAMQANPDVAAMTCYFLAFQQTEELAREHYLYAYRPTGGPHVLAGLRNVYGDANALFRTALFRAVGAFETDRHTSCEDWEALVKLVHAGHRVEVLPEHLFYYRHLDNGFSRTTSSYLNHQRVLRQFDHLDRLPLAEKVLLWRSFIGFQRHLQHLAEQQGSLRYRIADQLHALCRRVPAAQRALKWLFLG